MKRKIQSILNTIRPALAMHAGDVELVGFERSTGTVNVRLKGTCVGCPVSSITVKEGIEKVLKHELPEIKKVAVVS